MDNGESYEGLIEDVGEESRKPHHEQFDDALALAVDQIPPGPPGWYKVEAYVYVKHSSPGWVDGYSVKLKP